MAKPMNFDEERLLRLIIYGRPGAGKTRLAGTACLDERTGPVLWLDAAGNPESLYSYPVRPKVIRVEDLKDLNDPYRWIMGGQNPGTPFAAQFDLEPPYRTLVIDHITDVQRMSYAQVLGMKNASPGDFNPPMEWQHHGQVLGQMLNFAKAYFTLPIHIITTAHEKQIIKDGNVTYIEPLIWGQAGSAVPGYALGVGRLVPQVDTSTPEASPMLNEMGIKRSDLREGVNNILFMGQSSRYAGKDQYGCLGPYMYNPTITDIMDRLSGRTNQK